MRKSSLVKKLGNCSLSFDPEDTFTKNKRPVTFEKALNRLIDSSLLLYNRRKLYRNI